MTALAFDKLPKGTTWREEREAKRNAIKANGKAVADAVRKRDGVRCRIRGCRITPVECAHKDPKGMGGDHGERTNTANCLRLCILHHRAPRNSVHSGDLEIIPLTAKGCDGPLAFHWKQTGETVKESA